MSEELTISAIMEELRSVMDPEYFINIVDMGLVYDIVISDKKIEVIFTLTHEGCPFGPQIEEEILACLSPHTDKLVLPRLVLEPPWKPHMMADEIKLEMGIPI